MRILWIKMGGLWPPDSGGRLRSFHLLSELSRRHRVILATTHTPGEDPGALAPHLPACELISVPALIPKHGSPRFLRALLRSWLSSRPVDLEKFRVPALAREVRRLTAAGDIDLCVADFLTATANVPLGGPTPVLLFAHNVEHMIWKRLARIEGGGWRRALLAVEWRKMRRAEARACARATATAAVSEVDRERLSALAPGARVSVVPTGVDASYFVPDRSREIPARLVFTGSMDWHPNEDAILYFLEEILPLVRQEVPEASLAVVGRNPSPRLLAAAAVSGVRVTGRVDDVRPAMAEAEVYVVPLRIGGGTRLKIFEALAMGKAVVSTGVGAEGLPLVPGGHFLQEDRPDRFARAVIDLLRDPAWRRSLGDAGRRLVEARYAWPRVARDFEARCVEAVEMHGARRAPSGASWARAGARLGRLLPRGLVAVARAFRDLDPRARSIYWRLRLRRLFRRGAGDRTPEPGTIRSLLFVCRGNIIRSPMAEALLRARVRGPGAAGLSIASAGLRAEPGRGADARARIVAREIGVSLEGHRARPLTDDLVSEADSIVAMDSLIEAELMGRYPAAASKVRLLRVAGPGTRGLPVEIADPYDGDMDEVRRCTERLRAALERETAWLAPADPAGGGLDTVEEAVGHAR